MTVNGSGRHGVIRPDRHNTRSNRCKCLTPIKTQCTADATQEDQLCDRCRERPVADDGKHWCSYSQTPPMGDSPL